MKACCAVGGHHGDAARAALPSVERVSACAIRSRPASSAAPPRSDGPARSDARSPANRRRQAPRLVPLPAVEPNIAASERRDPALVLHVDAGAVLDEPLNDRVVSQRGRDVQGRIAGLVRGIHIAAQADGGGDASRTRLSGSTLPKSIVSIPRRLARRARSHARRQHQRRSRRPAS